MKTTIDLPDLELEAAMRHTGARTKREAVVTALVDFNLRKTLERLAEQLGTFEDVMSLEELHRLRREG